MNVILPELGEDIEKATVACWLFQIGDFVREGDDLVELVTDKASFSVPAGKSGRIKQIFIFEGQEAKIGQPLAVIE